MHRMGLFLALGLLAGCAETGRSGLQARMATLVGATEAELLARMGPPAYDHTYAGKRTLGYSEQWSETHMNAGGGPADRWREVVRRCEVAFVVAAGRVTGFKSHGNGCGWAGRQNFPQV